MIHITALFFAHYQDIVGGRELRFTVPKGSTVAGFAQELTVRFTGLSGLLSHGRVAVNAEFADADTVLQNGDEVAWMPPMSGGSGGCGASELPEIALVTDPIDLAAVTQSVEAPSFGAVVTFAGNVRDNAQGNRVLYLEYEAYAPLAHKQLLILAEQAEGRWGVRCAVTHRLGRLEIGECSVAVAAASAHRGEAFEACRWLMDTLKVTVPIWKKEYFVGGAHWIEGPQSVPAQGLEPAESP